MTASHPTSAAAGQANAEQAARLIDARRAFGVPDTAIRTTGNSISAQHAHQKVQVTVWIDYALTGN